MDQVNVIGHKTATKANSVLGEVSSLSFLSNLHSLLGKHCHQVPVMVLMDVDLTSPLFLQLPVLHFLLFCIFPHIASPACSPVTHCWAPRPGRAECFFPAWLQLLCNPCTCWGSFRGCSTHRV